MSDRGEPITLGKDAAPDERDRRIAELEAELEKARAGNAALKARVAGLERQLAELQRSGCASRAHWLRFPYVGGLDATNNQAERMLRPAVITRTTSGCNRSEGGAEAHSTRASIWSPVAKVRSRR